MWKSFAIVDQDRTAHLMYSLFNMEYKKEIGFVGIIPVTPVDLPNLCVNDDAR
jgi:hypothetical protein